MTGSRSFVVLVMFAALGLSYGFQEDCNDWFGGGKSNIDLQICLEQTPRYKEIRKNMQPELKQKLKSINFNEETLPSSPITIGDSQNCEGTTTTITPYVLHKRMENSYHYLIQEPGFKQTVNVTKCDSINAGCMSEVFGANNNKKVTCCREKTSSLSVYIYRNKQVSREIFEFPVSCTCMVRNKMNDDDNC